MKRASFLPGRRKGFVLALLTGALASVSSASQEPSAGAVATSAPLEFQNRSIIVFRAPLLGYPPGARAEGARKRIAERLGASGPGAVSSRSTAEGHAILIDEVAVFMITADDVNSLEGETLDSVTEQAKRSLERAVREAREQQSLRFLVVAAALVLLATLVYLLLIRGLFRVRRRLHTLASKPVAARIERLKIAGETAVRPEMLLGVLRQLLGGLTWGAALLVSYVWLSFCLTRFPYTRPWGEGLSGYLLNLLATVAAAIVKALPGFGLVVVIFIATRFLSRLVEAFFRRIETLQTTVGWLDGYTAAPTRRILVGLLWLFALAMAFPHLPGADTEAFKGLSVLAGLMISLGGSGLVGQALAGLSLMYTQPLRPGEQIAIGEEIAGIVVSVGMMRTKIRTGAAEEVSVPNALIVGSSVRNYSRLAPGGGFAVKTSITIGYATPWRQVHALLLEAARRTRSIRQEPPPRVLQSALSDFYVEYRLVAGAPPGTTALRGQVLNELHSNIQDVFNEYGVQIMSPHYENDPESLQVVPKDRWYAPPAQPPEGERGMARAKDPV